MHPVLLIVAHGSRDPRHAATVAALAARVAAARPYARVETCYLDHCAPRVPRALRRLYDEGVRDVVALPLLLARAFHAKSDIPAELDGVRAALPRLRVVQGGVLGPDAALTAALDRRMAEAGLRLPADRARTGVVLAAAGSSDPEAIASVAETAREWRRTAGWCAVRPAFASAAPPRTADAVRALRADGAERVAVAPYVIAPGFLPDRIVRGAAEARADVLAPVLGAAPELAELLARRYDEARAGEQLRLTA